MSEKFRVSYTDADLIGETYASMKKILFATPIMAISMTLSAEQSYSPYVNRDYPENVYWGDTHLHTYLSGDAYSFGATITPDQAYRFAKGETIRADGGEDVRIRRHLDFIKTRMLTQRPVGAP